MISRRAMMQGGLATLTLAPAMARSAMTQGRANWFDEAIVIDGLGGLEDTHGEEGITRMSDASWAELKATGVSTARITVMPVGNGVDAWEEYRADIEAVQQVLSANPDRLQLVRKAADIRAAKKAGRFGVVIGTQDTSMVGSDLDRLETMKEDGVRSVQLTYNNRNLSGDGAIEPDNAGLSKLGRATIERIEAEKLLLDLSHGGARTMAEAVAMSARPLVISHTGARALTDHPRNTSDETIRAVADKGGVVGVYFMPYLSPDMVASDATVIAHVEHIANIAGENHVGIGTDNGPMPVPFDEDSRKDMDEMQQARIDAGIAAPGEKIGFYPLVKEYNSIDRYRRFARDLERRGWSQARLEKLMGTNFLRVYEEAWEG